MNHTDSADNMDADNLDEVEVPAKKVDNRVRGKGDKGRCTKSNSKRNYCKKRKSPWTLKKESEGVVAKKGKTDVRSSSSKKIKYIKKQK